MALGVCSIRVLAKNHGDPYYEPTIVVHDYEPTIVVHDKNAEFSIQKWL